MPRLLRFYPDRTTVLKIRDDLEEVEDKRLNSSPRSKRAAMREKSHSEADKRATVENVKKLLDDIEKGNISGYP